MFIKAERKKSKLRLALCGISGSGKTLGALFIAKGIGGKIAVIDTEAGSASLYSDDKKYDLTFDTFELSAPFSPDRYIQAIKYAESAGYTTLIIDSLSHAWSGEGGILDMQDKATKASSSKNSYYAWRDVTPLHNKLVDAMLQSSMHIICCMRCKASHETIIENGKAKPVKVGLAPIQRDGLEYEFTIVLDLDRESHLYTASKDRTNLFEGSHEKITEETGKKLMQWLNSGKDLPTQEEMIDNIKKSSSLDELKQSFSIAYNSYKDNERIRDFIITAKDKRKYEIESAHALHESS